METAGIFTTGDDARIAYRLMREGSPVSAMTGLRSRCLAALLGLAAAFQAAAQEAPAEAFLLRELFRPVAAQPGLGGLPIHARVSVADDVVDCDILAVVARRPEQVMALLGSARGWCEIALLHPNVKACVEAPGGEDRRLVFHVGSKRFQPAALSRPLRYDLSVERHDDGRLAARLRPVPRKPAEDTAPVLIEAIALDGARTGLRVRYREPLSAGARLLAAGYFATFGRDKVGFSTTGVDAEGNPVHVGGLAGAIERNIVRHFLAIETILETGEAGIALSPEQRLEHWHALTERHARQLRELDRAEYLDIKRREFAQSAELQKSLDAQAGD